MDRTAVVVGGGIGGLTAAAALTRTGWRVTVLERAPRTSPIGAGITLMANALRALDVLGLGDQVRAAGRSGPSGGLRNPAGRWLSRADVAWVELVALHRADLHGVLHGAVPQDCLVAGAEVTGVTGDGVRYTVAGRERVLAADLVVAADGVNSVVRAARWPDAAPRYSGVTAWRAVTEFPDDLELAQTWGGATEFGVVPLTGGRVYWFAASPAPQGVRADDELGLLRERLGGWAEPVPQLLAATAPGAVLHHDLFHLPPLKSYVDGRVVLLGDAAHAMVPNLGQGACQAVEDAVVLASVCRGDNLSAALAEYDRLRGPRTRRVAATALRLARFGLLGRSRPGAALRDLLIRAVPADRAVRSMGWLTDWLPPPL